MGVTGSGKTAITQELDPERYEIVGCDSRQIYRELEVGTACPPASLRSRIRHHLVAWSSPSESFSAGRYADRAREALREIVARGREPLIVGGTGFYYQALRTGLFGVSFSEESRALVTRWSPGERLERLQSMDPDALVPPGAAGVPGRIHPNDEYRVQRALEVCVSTGIPWSKHWREARTRLSRNEDDEFRYEGWTVAVGDDWADGLLLRARAMLEGGILQEAEHVRAQYGPHCPGLKTLGYDLALRGVKDLGGADRFTAELAAKHRQYAKRQRTWFRREKGLVPADAGTIIRALCGAAINH